MPAGPKTPRPARRFVPGAAIDPPQALIAWLDTLGDRLVRLPVVMRLQPMEVTIGGFRIAVSDARMGISLADRVRRRPAPITVWLEGTWAGRLHVEDVLDRDGGETHALVTDVEPGASSSSS